MGRMYQAIFEAVAITVAQDLFELNCPATGICVIHQLDLFNTTDLGDAAEEVFRLRWKTGMTSSGSGGTGPTAIPTEISDAAFGGTVEVNNTTQASGGTIVTHESFGWNIRIPLQRIWTPETRPILAPSGRGVIELVAAPADSVTTSGCLTFEWIG